MTTITDEQLNKYCKDILLKSLSLNDYFTPGIDLLYHTGCRYIEAYDFLRWEKTDFENVYHLKTAKRNAPRLINISLCTDRTKKTLELKKNYYTMLNYVSACNYFVKLPEVKSLIYQNKTVYFHAFRHRVFRSLYNDGWSLSEITAYMGEKYESTTLKYLNAVLSYRI